MKGWTKGLLALAVAVVFAGSAFAQGGGASSTGTIQGRVADAQGAVLPGVTVTATSPALIQRADHCHLRNGQLSFPGGAPGHLRTQLRAGRLQPPEALRHLDHPRLHRAGQRRARARDVAGDRDRQRRVAGHRHHARRACSRTSRWSSCSRSRTGATCGRCSRLRPPCRWTAIDVGGNRAGTQTGYRAYGQNGQVRVLIEGINTTEGTSGAGFYFDYASLEEAFLGTSRPVGGNAEPRRAVRSSSRAAARTQFQGEYHLDWYNNSLQGSNIPDEYTVPTAFNNSADPRAQQRDRPLLRSRHQRSAARSRKTRSGSSAPIASSSTRWQQPNFQFDKTFDTHAVERGRQGHLPDQPEEQADRLLPVGPEDSAEPPAVRDLHLCSPEPTIAQDSGSWVYKAEWNGTLSDKLYVEARYGDFGYYFPLITNSTDILLPRYRHARDLGAHQKQQNDRDRKQITGAATYFIDTAKGSHTFKFGARSLEGAAVVRRARSGVRRQHRARLQQRRFDQVIFRIPTATQVGGLKDNVTIA